MDSINDKINTLIIGGKYGFEFIPTEEIAKKIGVSAVGLRFMFGILVGMYVMFLKLLGRSSTRNTVFKRPAVQITLFYKNNFIGTMRLKMVTKRLRTKQRTMLWL